MQKFKKKVISFIVDTALTNEQIEAAGIGDKMTLSIQYPGPAGSLTKTVNIPMRNVRVLDG